MSVTFSAVSAMEVLDSRGRPTVSVRMALSDGREVFAGVPSGASTGSGEAVELRDGDATRYGGRGVSQAVSHVEGAIADALMGRAFDTLERLDAELIRLDGTPNKSRLGANAIVGVSMAAARAFASESRQPLWRWLTPDGVTPRLPVPHFNVINGGAHAPNPLDFQEFMIAPVGAPSLPEAIRAGAEVYARLRAALQARKLGTGLGDEGGFAPDIASPEEVLALLVEAITAAGYPPGRSGVAIALDPAASEFHRGGRYEVGGQSLSSDELIQRYAQMVQEFPIWSIEDGMGETDADGWRALTERLGESIQLVGDDNFVTNPALIRTAVDAGIANAALIKVNQVGTVSETLEALRVCREAGYGAMISHRSGETCDTFIADLAVGSGCGQIKSGAPARGERVAKYNRLAGIAAEAPDVAFGLPPR
ncbi:MAG: phosphopyruvate hydratase [Mycobacterium pseudokansasii]|uniref:phosphopyruvate hydratase n=1 Tax=Mycobacterium pseudokansasii TaxID=2341080 RepID=UPI00056C83F4|nr:phosphopyruvate hydratase [Mycobacterium pseudokansasii]KZS68053.1 phosphopyruvate hydratase [Mycobacterium kansasii]MBY0391132.1 phosphopyruvate hydratase [Mycobacterium pseudokansasii]VAZ99748.1 Enolase [Mycobacterium pseudokansasii]VBA30956.1 Enolase [Mycobacterium pseudokansasii]